jgi:lysine 2,3-aminomutase
VASRPALAGPPRLPAAPSDQSLLDARWNALAARERLLPVKVTAFYRAKIDAETAALGHAGGPLHRTAHPPAERFDPPVGSEVDDWVDDRSNMPVRASRAIVHKYPDRVLFMPTPVCAGHCQYCFRQDVLSEEHAAGRPDVDGALDELLAYLPTRPEIGEVILSGGDPLTLPARDLVRVLDAVRSVPQIRSIRIHTRAIVFAPKVFDDPARLDALARADARVVLHVVHPYEICGDVAARIAALRSRDVRLYAHFPLLRGVNDHVSVVRRLVEDLDDLRVRTLSVYVPEPVRHSAPWRIPLARFFAIQDELTRTTPGWVNAIRFTLDTPVGKVRREDMVSVDPVRDLVTFERNGRRVVYPDFPARLDRPGDPAVLLWRG